MSFLEQTQGIRDFIRRKVISSDIDQVNAWVFIWYANSHDMGHASMFIGDISKQSSYVSWWPQYHGHVSYFVKYPAGVSNGYEADCSLEKRVPDVVYGLKGLDDYAMRIAWRDICIKENASFTLMSKNCSSIVRRILKAGLVHSPLRHKVFGVMDGGFYTCTPKRVAVVCNNLRDNNMAVKIKMHAKLDHSSIFDVIFRLR
ncbi:hypothetical protein [Ewingella americana]